MVLHLKTVIENCVIEAPSVVTILAYLEATLRSYIF